LNLDFVVFAVGVVGLLKAAHAHASRLQLILQALNDLAVQDGHAGQDPHQLELGDVWNDLAATVNNSIVVIISGPHVLKFL
jgi:hypothetical protein